MLMVDSWRERKKLELKQALYRKAIELFESEGYENTTVQQISEAVGVAKGTFFNHFPGKEHVVSEWYNEITARAIRVLGSVDCIVAVSTFGMPQSSNSIPRSRSIHGNAFSWPIATRTSYSSSGISGSSARQRIASGDSLSSRVPLMSSPPSPLTST